MLSSSTTLRVCSGNWRTCTCENALPIVAFAGDAPPKRISARCSALPIVGDVRGAGLFCGAELVADRQTKEPMDEKKVAAVVAECNAQGVIIGMTNRSLPGLNNTLCLSPALIATKDDIDHITNAMDGALTRVFG